MRFGIRAAALAGMLVLSGMAAASDKPYALGQQWRSLAGPEAGQGPSHRHFTNAPVFRPRSAGGANRHLGYAQMPRYPSPSQPGGRLAYRDARAHGPYANPAYAGYGHPPRPMSVPPPMAAIPAWGYPPGGLARSWQPPQPLFARQFAWRPAAQPWLVRSTAAAPIRYPVPVNPAYAHYRQPLAPVPMHGSWRPDARQFAYQAPGYTGQQQSATWAPMHPLVPGSRTARFAGFNPAATGMHRGSWRPGGQMHRAAPLDVAAFRPASHGRSESASGGPAAGGVNRAGDALPGWVTSYQETHYAGPCSWCAGG